ncbi:MAG: adenylate/guanylate cyclase domain-containing protein [Rhodopila sp.]|nr:adenylate/guanylate cyclase domain-containing protein [Rhodopila sp.]
MDVASWLRNLGLERYEAAFRENDVSAEVLCHLTAEDLKELGVAAVGDRRRLLAAIAGLRDDTASPRTVGSTDRRASPSATERRQITVLFCDIVDSTPLSTGLDPEELREILTAYQVNVAAAVTGEQGYIARFVGDGVLAYFGWPNADEAHAESAVRAGLAIIEAVGLQQLAVRVGIATGLVVTGDLVGVGAAQTITAVGETPNLASRLQALAQPDTVVVAEATRAQLGRMFELEDLGLATLKGFDKPVRAWRVLGKTEAASRSEAVYATALSPLVGRDEELGLLLRLWRQAKAGDGRVVLLSGEPGIGKSRLLAALEERLAGEPRVSLRYFCSPHHQDSPLYPVIARLEREAGFIGGDTATDRLAKLEAVLAPTSPPPDDIALLAAMLSIPTDGRCPALELSPQQRKARTFTALFHRLSGLAFREPVLMLFEDAHWSDPTSVELLDAVIELVATLPVLLVVSFRPEFAAPWSGCPRVHPISLGRLDRRDAITLAERIVTDRALSTPLLDRIVMQSDGVPLFIEELTRAVLEAPELDTAGTALAVPDTLQASLMARLDRLPTAKQVAQIGAVIGREFPHALLSAVARMPEPQLAQGIEELVASGLVFRRGSPPDAGYAFKHALVQDIAYESLLRSRRRELHRHVVESLEDGHPRSRETQPEILAHHCTNAGLIEKAIPYWLAAGQQAIARSALVEAIAQMQKGLDLLRDLPDSAERDRQELKLQLAMGGALIAVNGYAADRTGRTYVRARQLCEQLGDTPGLFRALWGEFVHHHVRGELDRSLRAANDLLNLAERENDKTGQLAGHRAVGDSLLHLGRLVAARAHLEKGLGLSDPMDHRALTFLFAENARVASLSFLSMTLAALGFVDQAVARTGQALEEARGLSHPTSVAFALSAGCRVHSVLGNIPMVRQLTEELIDLSTEQNFAFFHSMGTIYRGWVHVEGGESAIGMELMQTGIASFKATGAAWILPLFLGRLSKALANTDQVEEGITQLSTALDLCKTMGVRCYEAELHRIMGELLLARPVRCDIAVEAHLKDAIILARQQKAKLFELRASVGLARWLTRHGRRAEARDLLAPIYAWFTEGFDMPDLRQARQLLATLIA